MSLGEISGLASFLHVRTQKHQYDSGMRVDIGSRKCKYVCGMSVLWSGCVALDLAQIASGLVMKSIH